MLLILTLQVVARFIFGTTFSWSEEISRYLFIWFIFFGMSYATLEKSHISIDSLIKIFPIKIRDKVEKVGLIVWLIFCLAISYIGITYTYSLIISEQFALGSGVPMWIVYSSIPLAFLLTAFRIIQRLVSKDVDKEATERVDV